MDQKDTIEQLQKEKKEKVEANEQQQQTIRELEEELKKLVGENENLIGKLGGVDAALERAEEEKKEWALVVETSMIPPSEPSKPNIPSAVNASKMARRKEGWSTTNHSSQRGQKSNWP